MRKSKSLDSGLKHAGMTDKEARYVNKIAADLIYTPQPHNSEPATRYYYFFFPACWISFSASLTRSGPISFSHFSKTGLVLLIKALLWSGERTVTSMPFFLSSSRAGMVPSSPSRAPFFCHRDGLFGRFFYGLLIFHRETIPDLLAHAEDEGVDGITPDGHVFMDLP